MDAQKTSDTVERNYKWLEGVINSSFLDCHFVMCKDLARKEFQEKIKDDDRYYKLMLLIETREAIPVHDCGAHDQPDWTLQTR